MQTTKNKIIKGIKTLAKGPLYGAVFVSARCKWFGTKKEITTITSTQSARKLIATDATADEAIEDIDEGIINQGSDVLEQPNLEEVSAVPAQEPTMPQTALPGSNKTNQKPVLVKHMENVTPRSSNNTLGKSNQVLNNKRQNIPPDTPNRTTNNDNNRIGSELRANNDLLKSRKDQGKDSMQAVKQETSPKQNPSTLPTLPKELQEKINHLKSLIDELNNLYTDDKHSKLLKKIEKIEVFWTHNTNPETLNNVERLAQEKKQKYIEYTSKQTDNHIATLTAYIKKAKNGQ